MSKDTISEILTRIRNANFIISPIAVIEKTNIGLNFCKILKQEGFIKSFRILSTRHVLLYLKYNGKKKKPVITHLNRISKPGRRIYTNYKQIPPILSGLGITLISTSKGILTDKDARLNKIGGELLCSIW